MQLQLTELLTRYGPVALIWFDGLHHQEKYSGIRFIELIRHLQSATLVNDRIGVPGDYQTPEQFIPSGIPTKGVRFNAVDTSVQQQLKPTVPKPEDFQLWETCMTINNTWAYNTNDHEFKSAQFLIRSLVEVASRGGNFLLNVGPQPDGQIQPEFQERLRAIGEWLSVNGESIYGTTYGPVQGVASIRTTAKPNRSSSMCSTGRPPRSMWTTANQSDFRTVARDRATAEVPSDGSQTSDRSSGTRT